MSPEDWDKTYNEAYRRIGNLLNQGKNVIDDSTNFTRVLRDRLRVIGERYGARTIVIHVATPLSEVQRRWQDDRKTALRPDVRDEDFMHVVNNFEVPGVDEHVICYDGSISLEAWMNMTFPMQGLTK